MQFIPRLQLFVVRWWCGGGGGGGSGVCVWGGGGSDLGVVSNVPRTLKNDYLIIIWKHNMYPVLDGVGVWDWERRKGACKQMCGNKI